MRIDRIVIWIVNGILGLAGCFFVALIGTSVVAEAMVPESSAPVATAAPGRATQRGWEDRQIILTRNLFNASVLAPAQPLAEGPIDADLEETKLPLTLLGTAAAADPELSWAAVEDKDDRAHIVVRLGDVLKGKAKVIRIERRRIVLDNRGKREELSLREEKGGKTRVARRAPARRRTPTRRNTQDLRERVKKLSENRFQVDRNDVQEAMRNPAELFSQARILPKYEDGQMVGVQLNSVKPGSLFEQIGIQSGDVIKELNGIAIDSPESSALLLGQLSDPEVTDFRVEVCGAGGDCRSLNFQPE